MIITDRNHGALVTTTGKLMWPAHRYWWEITAYIADDEDAPALFNSEFETEEAAKEIYEKIAALPGAEIMTDSRLPNRPYIVFYGVEYVLTAHDEQTTVLEGEGRSIYLED